MIKSSYNGWDSTVRSKRGSKFYALVKTGKIKKTYQCELCKSPNGITFHAEEYGSTWSDYIASCHELCCYCHGLIHVRQRFPNRWKRFVHRAVTGTIPAFPFTSMSQVYGVLRGYSDIPEYLIPPDLGEHWVLMLAMGPVASKVALAITAKGLLVPDFSIYPNDLKELSGLRYDSSTQEVSPYSWVSAPFIPKANHDET